MANTLADTPPRILRKMLIDLGLASDGGVWPAFAGKEPNSPDDCITVRLTPGTDNGRSMVTKETWGTFGFQVRVRSTDPATGWQKADELQTGLLQSVYQRTVHVDNADYFVHAVVNVGDVLDLGYDSPNTKREVFVLNAEAHIRRL